MNVADPNYDRTVFPPALRRLFRKHGAAVTSPSETVPPMKGSAVKTTLDRIAYEAERQDTVYGPFSADLPSVRLAIACLEDETRECREAFAEGKRRVRHEGWENPDWFKLREEATQVAAIALRLVRDIDASVVVVD